MIALVEGAQRQKTPNEIALSILLAGLTIIFLRRRDALPFASTPGQRLSVTVLVALLVCLIPTTIGGLLSAIGIAGMDRVMQRNVLAMSGRAVEAAGDVDTLLLDKTGTITLGNRQATESSPRRRRPRRDCLRGALSRWPTRPPKDVRSWCWRKQYGVGDAAAQPARLRAVQRVHADERTRLREAANSQGRAGCGRAWVRDKAARPVPSSTRRRTHRSRTAARRY